MPRSNLLSELTKQGWLTTQQVADMFGVPRRYVNELTMHRKERNGRRRPPLLQSHKIGHLLLVRTEEAQRYQARHPRLGQRIAERLLVEQRAAS